MKLEEYLSFLRISGASFAKTIGIKPAVVYAAIKGDHSLNIFNALIIEAATNGDVKAIDLCSDEQKEKIWDLKTPYKKIGGLKKGK